MPEDTTATPKPKRDTPLNRPVQPDAILGALVGTEPISRPQITKKLWDYVKTNKLLEGRIIKADAKLKVFFGGEESIEMMKLARFVSNHLIK